ncbi:MAG: sigma-54-dependent Fis family transcriptional regulator [bacterium]|nr:sigma-54-dependent Fis family transcriptional regulator [bacterium]
MKRTIFIIEDDKNTCELYEYWLARSDYSVRVFNQAEPALAALESFEPAAICLDLGLPGMSGGEALAKIRKRRPQVPVMVITGDDDAKAGVEAMKLGARDYLVKPIDQDEFENVIRLAVQQFELVLEVRSLRQQMTSERRLHEIVGQSTAINRVLSQVGLLLENDVPIFISGETGTGKELLARTIHDNSRRNTGPFVPVNCGAIPSELQESQFFGHERGAFTGAAKRHLGFFESARGGTIFLDEVGELSLDSQVKLLRVLQEHRVRRVGGEEEVDVDLRVISATNRDLNGMVKEGTFREDLFYRLVVYPLEIPPLRERKSDIPLLLGHYLRRYSEEIGIPLPEITDDVLRRLVAYEWPGNVREIQNVVQFALLASQGEPIETIHMPPTIPQGAISDSVSEDGEMLNLIDPLTGLMKSFDRIEMEVFLRARELANGNMTRAAEMLGVGRATLYRRMQTVQSVYADD